MTELSAAPTLVIAAFDEPEAIRAAIQRAKDQTSGVVVVAFQPRGYSRCQRSWREYTDSLAVADRAVITDIDADGESPIAGVSAWRIAEALKIPAEYIPQVKLVAQHIQRRLGPEDTIVFAGSGSIQNVPPILRRAADRSGSLSVWVVAGGDSAEREVSLHSGRSMAAALQRKGFRVDLVDISDGLLSDPPSLPARRPDVAVLAVHGTNAEDGAIQGLFELMHVPYSGSGVQASALAMDKNLTKAILGAHGVPTPQGHLVNSISELGQVAGSAWVVKPNAQGSTVGLSFVERPEDLRGAVQKALSHGSGALVEDWIRGTEISVPVLGNRALPPVEIVPRSGQYDFANKYEPGATEEICPARLPENLLQRAESYALRAHQALGCAGATRTDMIVSGDSIVVLEVNTLPGMTATSLLPKSAETAGIPYDDLCVWLLEDALLRYASR